MLHCSDARLWALAGLLQTWHLAFKQKNLNLCFITPENFVSRGLRGFQVSFAHPLRMLSIHTKGIVLPNKPDWWTDWSLILPWFPRLPRLPSKSPGGCKCLPFADHGGQRGHYWIFSAAEVFPQICFSVHSCLWGLKSIPWTSWLGLCSNTHCQLWCLI